MLHNKPHKTWDAMKYKQKTMRKIKTNHYLINPTEDCENYSVKWRNKQKNYT